MPEKILQFLKKFWIYIVAILSIAVNSYFLISKDNQMVVTEVHDGDTFTLKSNERVRLLGVDAPELSNCGATESASLLKSLVLGKTVKITDEKRDNYGRRMGLVWKGSILVNEKMLKAGWAKPNYDPNSKSETLKTAYKYASENKLGVYSSLCKKINPTPTSPNCTIKGNIDKSTGEHFYHLTTCPHYNQIVLDLDIGEKFFCTEKEAKEAGFEIASECDK